MGNTLSKNKVKFRRPTLCFLLETNAQWWNLPCILLHIENDRHSINFQNSGQIKRVPVSNSQLFCKLACTFPGINHSSNNFYFFSNNLVPSSDETRLHWHLRRLLVLRILWLQFAEAELDSKPPFGDVVQFLWSLYFVELVGGRFSSDSLHETSWIEDLVRGSVNCDWCCA